MTVARDRRGKVTCNMTPPTLQLVTEQVNDALEAGIKEGLLARGGFWHRMLKGDSMPIRGNRLLIWTGHMIRPRSGLWLLVGGAYNRRSRVSVVDHVASDPDHFVPLVIELDTRQVTKEPLWMEAELGCIVPLSPAVRMRKEPLAPGAAARAVSRVLLGGPSRPRPCTHCLVLFVASANRRVGPPRI